MSTSKNNEDELMPQVKNYPKIRKSSLAPPGMNLDEKTLFDTNMIESNATPFNIVNPGMGAGDAFLRYKNPCLLAMGNKSKLAKTHQPPKTSVGNRRLIPPLGQGITSLLSKKPLADLPEPPMALIEAVKNREELERLSLDFHEDPVAYFSKRKDGRGHLFIYMKYAKDQRDPDFSPYELIKVPHCDIGKDYFTMSASGVTHVDAEGNTDHISLDIWAKEESIFKSIRKLKTFQNYLLWKPLRLWKYFIMEQRYNETADKVIDKPIYYNECFSTATVAIATLLEKSDEILLKNLLCLYPTRKYKISDYRKLCSSNMHLLKEEYSEFVSDVTTLVGQLDTFLSDPEILKVRDNEFAEIRRKNPNIGQLIVLERKKDAERIRRTEQMGDEMNYLANYLRMTDYMLLESLRNSCFDAFRQAEFNCMQDQSAIFLIEVFFANDGKVSFKPSVEELAEEVRKQLEVAFKTIEGLPRLLRATSLRHVLRDNNSVNIPLLFDDGPDFSLLTQCSSLLKDVEESIITIIRNSYQEAEIYSEIFKDFFPLYKLGQTWDVHNFITTSSGEMYKGPLFYSDRSSGDQDDEFLLNPERAPILDFDSLRALIEKLNVECKRVGSIKSGNTRGILHIDSRNLKMVLTPIPMKSLTDINTMLKDLVNFKTEIMNHVFKNYSMKLKSDPTTLDMFVDYCELLQKTTDLIPQMKKEITFIDDLVNLIEDAGFEAVKNQLHQPFHAFKVEQGNGVHVRNANHERFEFLLSQLIKTKDRKLAKYKERSLSNLPMSTQDMNNDLFYKQTLTLKAKVSKIRPTIENVIHFQDILNAKTTDFPDLAEIDQNLKFAEKLCQAIRVWDSISSQTKDVPFVHIEMSEFIENASKLQKEIEELKNTWKKPSPILSEISVDFQEILPYLEQLSQLSFGRMQTRHWNQLFEECGQTDVYNPDVTIQQLLALGILNDAEKIREITINSQGESQLENEFRALKDHWDEIELPLKDPLPGNEEDLRLAPLEMLLADIDDTAITLNSMMTNKFVHGIYDDVFTLSQNMDLIVRILDQWQKFECNWIVISNLMKQNEIITALPHQASRFEVIQDKWREIIKHTLNDKKLFSVFAFQNLLEDFYDNNKNFEIIFTSLSTFLDKKREQIPRLYFLSNDEIITLLSTTDFSMFTAEVVKMMMHISQLDSHSEKESEIPESADCNFSDLKISGLIGEDGDSLQFMNPISCTGSIDQWIPNLFSAMNDATKEAVAVSLSRYSSTSLDDWVMTVTSYIAVLTLQVSFTRDIEDCFNNLETNPKVFLVYQSNLKHKIQDLMSLMTTPLSNAELTKVSALLSNVIFNFEKTKLLHDRLQLSSTQQTWHDMLKFKYDTTSMDITIQFGDNTWLHGHEFWGKASTMMMTPQLEHALLNMCQARVYDQVPLIFGPFGVGKTEIIRLFASYLGKYVYSAAAFPSFANFYCSRILMGASISGSWVLFSEIEQLNPDSLSFMFDSIRAINDSKIANNPNCYINGNFVELNPNTRIFLTSSLNSYLDGALPPQLRVYVRPISMSAPLIKKIIETKLITFGYKASKDLSDEIDNFVTAVVPLFKLTQSRLQHCLKIVNAGQDLLRQLMHSNKVEFVNYYEDSRTAEVFSIARSAFDHFKTIIDDSKNELLTRILHSHFPIFGNYTNFKACIINPYNFFLDKVSRVIREIIQKSSKSMGIDFPIDYLTEKAGFLFQMMRTSPCIIICGPSNSGKSVLVELLAQAYLAMVADADIVNHFKGIMPFKISTIYQNSNSWNNIFGNTYNDELQGTMWSYGLFQTVLTNLNFFKGTHHRILRFDGHMTHKFCKFLYQFVSEDARFRINSLGSFPTDSTFHCIVETDDISNLTPEILSVCGVLSLNNLQIENGLVKIMKTAKLPYPNFPFSIVTNKFGSQFTKDEYKILSDIFSKIAAPIIDKVAHMPHLIDFLSLSDKYAEKAATYGLQHILNRSVKVVEFPENAQFLMIRGFFDIFSSILPTEKIADFDSWLCDEFDLSIPDDWSGLTVSEQFVEEFPKPTLASLQIADEKIAPIDHSLLSSRAIVHIEDGGAMPLFINDVIIPNASFLLPIIKFEASMQTKSNILLFGPCFSGKSSMLSYIFHNNKDVCPIEISLTPLITTENIIEIISSQTNLMRRLKINLEPLKLFSLVFSNIDQADNSVLEFIRALMATNTIQLTSHSDPKIYDQIQLTNFFVVIKASKINHLPIRFVSLFTPIQLQEYPKNIKLYICKKAMNAFGINSDLVQIMNVIIDIIPVSLSSILNIILSISHIPERAAASDEDKAIVFRLLLSEIYFTCFNCNIDNIKKFLLQAKQKIAEMNFGAAQEIFEKDHIFAAVNYQFTQKIGKFNSKVVDLNDEEMKKKLIELMKSNVSDLTMSNFLQLSISLLRPGHNCVISSITGSARIAMCKLFSSVFGFNFVDLTEETTQSIINIVKTAIIQALTDNKTQLFVIRVNENNINDYYMLSSIFGNLNICHLFNLSELDDLIKKVSSLERVDSNARREWNKKIGFMIRCRCRLVVAKDCSVKQTSSEKFDDVRILSPTRESICENFIEKQNIRNVMISISKRIDDILPIHHLNQFYDFVNVFSSLYQGSTFDTQIDIQTVLDFINRLTTEKSVFNESLNGMLPELDKLREEHQKKKEELDVILNEIEEGKNKLNEEKGFKEKDLNDKKEELRIAKEDLISLDPILRDAKIDIGMLTEKDVKPIKLTQGSVVPSIKMMLEILCILRGIDKDNSDQLLGDPKFLRVLEEIKVENVTQETLDQIKPYLNEECLQRKKLETVAPILITLLRFVNAIVRYSSQCLLVKQTQTEIEVREDALSEFLGAMKEELKKFADKEKENSEKINEYRQFSESLQKLEDNYNLINSQKDKIESILSDTDKLVQSWSDFCGRNRTNTDKKCGDSVLYALYLSFCGICDIDKRKEIINIASDELVKANIATSFRSPYEDVSAKLTSKSSVTIANTDLPQNILLEIEHIFNSPQPPLLIDPDDIIVEAFLNANKAFIISVNSVGFYSALIESMKEGKILFITDVDYLHQKASTVFRLSNKNGEITLNGTKFTKNPNFKPVFVTNITDLDLIPIELVTRTTIINAHSSCLSFVNSAILRSFINHFEPRHVSTLSDLAKAEIAKNMTLINAENEIIRLIHKMAIDRQNDEKYSYLDDAVALDALIEAKKNYLGSLELIEHSFIIKKEMEESVELLRPLISLCGTMWLCLSRYMPKIQRHYRFQFVQFQKTISTTLHTFNNIRTGKINEKQLKEIRKTLLDSLLQWVYPSFTLRDVIFFMFLTAFLSMQYSFDDLSLIVHNLSEKLDVKYSTLKPEKNVDQVIEKLKSANLSDFFDLTMTFVLQFFGDDLLQNFPIFQVENVIGASPTTPTMILSDDQRNDVTQLIISYVSSRARLDNFVSRSLSDDPTELKDTLTAISTGMTQGNWVLLHYWTPSMEAAEILNEMLFLLHSTSIHTNFRLIVNVHVTNYISPFLFSKCRRFALEPFPSVRQTMRTIFYNYQTILRTDVNMKTLKRIFYISGLTYSMLQFRQFVDPIGFKLFKGSLLNSVREVVDYIKPLLEGEIHIRNLRDFVQDIAFGSQVIETQDRRCLRAILATMFHNSVLDDNFTFLDSNSSESHYWLPPSDVALNVIQTQIKNMPLFQTTDILMTNKSTSMPFLRWNLSNYLAKPFLSILNEDENESENEIENMTEEEIKELNEETEKKFKDIGAIIPTPIEYSLPLTNENQQQNEDGANDPGAILSPLLVFWLSEIDFFNYFIQKISKEVNSRKDEIKNDIINETVPQNWKKISQIHTISNLKQFILFFGEKRKFLLESVKCPFVRQINIALIDNLKGFFAAYLHEFAFCEGVEANGLMFEFSTQSENPSDDLIVNGIFALNAKIEGDNLVTPKFGEREGFFQFPPLYCSLSNMSQRGPSAFICPLYNFLLLGNKSDPGSVMMYDGETQNYIMDVYIPTERGDRFWLLNGTALYCHVPQNFV